jgi:hypothetical protein
VKVRKRSEAGETKIQENERKKFYLTIKIFVD